MVDKQDMKELERDLQKELEQKDAQIKELVEEIANAIGYIKRHPENGMFVVSTLEALIAKHRVDKEPQMMCQTHKSPLMMDGSCPYCQAGFK